MKIISKFNDYYDGISKSFYDDEIIFNRKFELIKIPFRLNKNTSPNISKLVRYFDYFKFYKKCILGYCGKFYQFSINDIDAESITIEDNHKNVPGKIIYNDFSEINLLDFNDLFIELDTPLFLYVLDKRKLHDYCTIIIKNPNLSYLNIAPHKNAMQVYQDVSMFISNILVNKEKSDVVISDKDLIIGKGFDYKTSFRKEKEK